MTDASASPASAPPSEGAASGYSVSLPTFEGPLDLLLHLCQKHELNILDIPIGFVTEKYLEYLKLMKLMSLDIAAEYLLMAATLAHIKSKMLLPQVPTEQQDDEVEGEEEDPREALIRRLLEYQKYKQAAADLSARPTGNDVFLRGAPMESVTAEPQGVAPIAEVSLFALMDAFQRVLERSKVRITHDIVTDRLSITDRINELVDILRERRRCEFVDLFQSAQTKFDLVITFLALLEMTKLRMTRLFQTDPLAPLYVELSSAEGEESPFAERKPAVAEAVVEAVAEEVPPEPLGAEAAASEPSAGDALIEEPTASLENEASTDAVVPSLSESEFEQSAGASLPAYAEKPEDPVSPEEDDSQAAIESRAAGDAEEAETEPAGDPSE